MKRFWWLIPLCVFVAALWWLTRKPLRASIWDAVLAYVEEADQ